VGRNPPVGPVSADEVNSQAGSIDIAELVRGDDVAVHSSVDGVFNGGTGNVRYVANVEPVVSTVGFAGRSEGNDDDGQHGRPGNNDVVPVSGSLVQDNADRRGQSTVSGTVADNDDVSGPKRRSSGPEGLLVNEGRSAGNSDADGIDVPIFIPMGHG